MINKRIRKIKIWADRVELHHWRWHIWQEDNITFALQPPFPTWDDAADYVRKHAWK